MQPGLVSVTFKDRPFEEVIHRAQRGGLECIEWHGLNHVPHGDLETARRVGESTRSAGLHLAPYGSYYVIGRSEESDLSFDSVLQTARALGTTMIRVWAGDKNPDDTSDAARKHIVAEARRIANLAAEQRIKLVLEFHENSLTQTGQSCAALLHEIDHPNVSTYWQPAPGLEVSANLTELKLILPWLVGLHVFHWTPTHLDRHPLANGEPDWTEYLALATQHTSADYALLEFVKGDTPEQFDEDAATLHQLLTA